MGVVIWILPFGVYVIWILACSVYIGMVAVVVEHLEPVHYMLTMLFAAGGIWRNIDPWKRT